MQQQQPLFCISVGFAFVVGLHKLKIHFYGFYVSFWLVIYVEYGLASKRQHQQQQQMNKKKQKKEKEKSHTHEQNHRHTLLYICIYTHSGAGQTSQATFFHLFAARKEMLLFFIVNQYSFYSTVLPSLCTKSSVIGMFYNSSLCPKSFDWVGSFLLFFSKPI